MRNNYPLLSQELNDRIFTCYENLTYLLGQNLSTETMCSGLYQNLETFCSGVTTSYSGIPNINNSNMLDILKFDYIYRKHFNQIHRS